MKQINRDILKLAVPSILANITVPLVGMADIAVAGHLDSDSAAMIGGIAVGSMLFDLLYWNFSFLRVGTGGLAAQAYGRGDMRECARIFLRAAGIALACALLLIAVQWVFVSMAFAVVDCTDQVRELASMYFFVRIWAAPATLGLMAFKGWFIGMQDSVSPMLTDLVVNGMNVFMSIVLALGISVGSFRYEGIGFAGIAAGTVMAQWTGLLSAVIMLLVRYRRRVFSGMSLADVAGVFRGEQTRRFFVMNSDLFVRSLCFIAIYIGFTTISARYGDLLLATGSIMMKLLLLFSYFTDGFAYAGEALTGRYVGAGDKGMMRSTVRWTFLWSMGIALVFMVIYRFAGMMLLGVMTSDMAVIDMARCYMPWLLMMPLVGCAAFTWDGIYIGATASKDIRNAMLWAVAAFVCTWGIGIHVLNAANTSGDAVYGMSGACSSGECFAAACSSGATRYGILAMHILMGAYFAHLLARTVYLSLRYRRL